MGRSPDHQPKLRAPETTGEEETPSWQRKPRPSSSNREFDRPPLIKIAYYVITRTVSGILLWYRGPWPDKRRSSASPASCGTPYLHLSPAKARRLPGVVPVPNSSTRRTVGSRCRPTRPSPDGPPQARPVVLDELRNCPRNLAAAMLSTLQEREFGDYLLPPACASGAVERAPRQRNGQPLSARRRTACVTSSGRSGSPPGSSTSSRAAGSTTPPSPSSPREEYDWARDRPSPVRRR